MKKLLPQTSGNPKGFTLIELLVVIAIIAILSVIGVALFTSTQAKARDSKRVQDITAMSKAMEVQYVQGTGYKTTVDPTWFADGTVPQNSNPGGASYYGTAAATSAGFVFCAALEGGNGNSSVSNAVTPGAVNNYFCRKNSQ
ncbi:MAG: prepilin-type N-terminal cleavage/methylation domain-containing protein [bacterium]|nr:prepilin-type N-terminal cleavage/methylation domain-containing protein [bacterium]